VGAQKLKKSEGGQGGRRGHSNMCHWITTAEIKESARILRRRDAKKVVTEGKQDSLAEWRAE
jgi:hypothetical protein